MNKTVRQLVEQGEEYLQKYQYCDVYSKIHYRIWERFEAYCNRCEITHPIEQDCDGFIDSELYMRKGKTSSVKAKGRAVRSLFCLEETGKLTKRLGKKRYLMPKCFCAIHIEYTAYKLSTGRCASTIYGKLSLLRRFLCYLVDIDLLTIEDLTPTDVYGFLGTLKGSSASSRSEYLFFLREFLAFLSSVRDVDDELDKLFPVIVVNTKDVLPSVYTAEEVRRVIAAISDSARSAKRTRAIILLAAQIGLRAGDIKGLEISKIDWEKRTLCFVQHKTGQRICLPLPDECTFALLDYLKNERPESDDPHVFVSSTAPHRAFGFGVSFHQFVSDCFEAAGIDIQGKHHGLHALRHSLAVGMLNANTDYPVISGVLGHVSANTTRRYLRVDTEHLRPLCLEVPHA
jgi:integrase